jgi:hypothetical protein
MEIVPVISPVYEKKTGFIEASFNTGTEVSLNLRTPAAPSKRFRHRSSEAWKRAPTLSYSGGAALYELLIRPVPPLICNVSVQ